jgi:hypothetical protein
MKEHLFISVDLADVLKGEISKVRDEIDKLDEEYLLRVDETELINHLIDKYTVDPPQLGEAFIAESKEVDVDVRYEPGRDVRDRSKPALVKGHRVVIHVPFSGDVNLFRCNPASIFYNPPQAEIEIDHLAFTYDSPGDVKNADVMGRLNLVLGEIRPKLNAVVTMCEAYNRDLGNQVRQLVVVRKTRLLRNREMVAAIGLPIKRRDDAPATYVVPDIKRKPKIARPAVTDKSPQPDPALDQEEYEHILSIVTNMVQVMERSPHAFAELREEDLRSHFLVQLNAQYEGRATGETFNYEGKTDILIREAGRNVFIAECAFWDGEAYLTKKINQVLGYLHWRDTKAAVIIFNRNKNFSEVLAQLESIVTKHPCCKKLLKKISDTEWRFLFCNKDDPNRELQLAVLLFEVPKPTTS